MTALIGRLLGCGFEADTVTTPLQGLKSPTDAPIAGGFGGPSRGPPSIQAGDPSRAGPPRAAHPAGTASPRRRTAPRTARPAAARSATSPAAPTSPDAPRS